MDSLVTAWHQSPWTIKTFVFLTAASFVTSGLTGDVEIMGVIFAIGLGVLFIFGLLRGSRTVWVLILIGEAMAVFSLVGIAAGRFDVDNASLTLAINFPMRALDLFVLLHPLTRAWLRPKASPRPTDSQSSTT